MSSSNNDRFQIPVIMGATASGKSSLAFEIAQKYQGEIISADSMQVYRGLDIGTAKPSSEEQMQVRHHLVDILNITEKYDVFRFAADAEKCVNNIRSAGHLPVVAGGTGLYLRAFLYGLDPVPADAQLRIQIDVLYDNDEHYPELCRIMEKEDPEDFLKFASNRRKLLRAREVFLLSGHSLASLQERWKAQPPRPDARSVVLVREPADLRRRITERCREMLSHGWIDEAEHFLKQGLHSAPTAWQVLGYRELASYLRGEFPKNELEERIVTATWQFARRQNTWFRTQHPEAVRIAMPAPDAIQKIMQICSEK